MREFVLCVSVSLQLPFVPFGFFQGLSHRGLEGDDYTDCSVVRGASVYVCRLCCLAPTAHPCIAQTFMYILASLAFRANLQKLMGTVPPKSGGMEGMWAAAQAQSKAKW